MQIEELAKRHDRVAFDYGVECPNTYLQNTARQHSGGGGSKTFVLVNENRSDAVRAVAPATKCSINRSCVCHLIENVFLKLKQFCAIATRYDKTARNFLDAVFLAGAYVWLN